MEDFYPFRNEDIPELHQLVEDRLIDKDRSGLLTVEEEAISFLLPLVNDLLDVAERIKSLKNTFQEEYGGDSDAKLSDGFWKIVEAYMEENNGTGNLLRVTEVLKSNGHGKIAGLLEKFLVRYSLPASSDGLGDNADGYSLSRDFLQAKEKGVVGDSVPIVNLHSLEVAFKNPVIMEKIFQKLHIEDQKLFRLVSPTWMEETFSFWRRNARILIQVSNDESEEQTSGISLDLFMDLWEKNKKKPEEAEGKEKEEFEDYKLQDNPFHCFKVRYQDSLDLLSSGKMDKFWQVCGDHVEDLKIIVPSFDFKGPNPFSGNSTVKMCKRLLQDYCQNLKRLEISGEYCWGGPKNDQAKVDNAEKTKIAKNLRTLKLEDVDEETLRSVLFICPNVKELTVLMVTNLPVAALLTPVVNGELIKLEKLILHEMIMKDDFSTLRKYTEMLAKNKFDSFKHLELDTLLSNARSPRFNLYAALARVSKNLKTLKLELTLGEDDEVEEDSDWFIDLSPFAFPNLTKLSLKIDFEDEECLIHPNYHPKFDFGTLKGMPLLEKLEIYAKNPAKTILRMAGAQDWVFEGDRNKYLPTRVVVDYQYSPEDPILCSNLKEFAFIGWSLNTEDIWLLSSWFPNLTRLEAEVNDEALPVLLKNWKRLEKLVLRTEKLISLWKLRPLKEEKKHLRIFQRILARKRVDDEDDDEDEEEIEEEEEDVWLELKEKNGMLFFKAF